MNNGIRLIKKLFLPILSMMVVISCASNPNDSKTISFPSENISFFSHVQPFFEEKCSCHTAGGENIQQMDLTSAAAVEDLKYTRYLLPGDPSRSDLYRVMEYPAAIEPQMPPNPNLPANSNQINGIKTWILEGADTTN